MDEFFERLKQRKLVQWALAYAAAAFALIQVLDIVAQRFGWPEQAVRFIIIALSVGFFVTLVLAWYHGERGAQRVTGTELLILALLLAIGGAAIWHLAPSTAEQSASNDKAAAKSTVAADTVADHKSIAVLAFSDLSPAHDQGYFSDGMAEEILNALTQIRDLKVTGRTSSFYYKNRNEDLRTIGKALGVANVLEGSVRKQDNKVRITAQLIRTDDGFHLWSHDYDGDLSDVFALQDRIARDITDALKPVLEGDQTKRLVPVVTTSPEAYTLYLQATDALNKRDYQRMGEAIGWLQQAIQLDPNFARAHSRLAIIHILGKAQFGASDSEAQRQAELALALDSSLAEAEAARSIVARKHRQTRDARTAMDRAIALDPDDAAVNLFYAQLLIGEGYTRQGIARLDRTLTIDAMLPNALYWRGFQSLYAGDKAAAEREFTRAKDLGLSFADNGLAALARSLGDYAKARELVLPFLLDNPENMACLKDAASSAHIFLDGCIGGDAPGRAKALAIIDGCLASKPVVVPLLVPHGLMRMGLPARALEAMAPGPVTDEAGLFVYLWGPDGRDTRRLPEFAQFLRKSGLADLWDSYGAPDACHKNAAGDYFCD